MLSDMHACMDGFVTSVTFNHAKRVKCCVILTASPQLLRKSQFIYHMLNGINSFLRQSYVSMSGPVSQ